VAISLAELPKTPQRVEKVGFEPIANPNWLQEPPKSMRLVLEFGWKRAPREFFNTLA